MTDKEFRAKLIFLGFKPDRYKYIYMHKKNRKIWITVHTQSVSMSVRDIMYKQNIDYKYALELILTLDI